MKIELREIDDGNRALCIALKTTPEQKAYIASNEDSLKEGMIKITKMWTIGTGFGAL